ncbi:MAG: hypothetical protein JWO11_461 [Nocardioides sp.]|nr:hypothetical protein [Nocardioides sp.]
MVLDMGIFEASPVGGQVEAPRDDDHADHGVRRAMIGLLACSLLLVGFGFASVVYVQHHLVGQVDRIDHVFRGLTDRPAKPSQGDAARAQNILLLGTDRRSDDPTTGTDASAPTWIPGAQRTDVIMILHVDGDGNGASLISIPRDAWVDVPGYGSHKINAAFSLAGPSLAVKTIETLTGVRIDHMVVVDWSGFEAITDAVGGVTVTVPRTIEDPMNHVVWTRGRQTLTGREALLYVRQRYGLPRGDLDRILRQQAYLRSLTRASVSVLHGRNPLQVYDLLDVASRNVAVDSEWSASDMRGLAMTMRGISVSDLKFLTAPVADLGWEGDQSVVHLDPKRNRELWLSVAEDRL